METVEKTYQMKTKFLIIIILSIILAIPAEARKKDKENGKGSASFTSQLFDFGTIREDCGSVSHNFEFVNTGNGNLVINEAKAECGCTRPDYPKAPIAPSKKGKIKVTFLPAGRPGAFEKTVTVNTNGNPRKIRLKIKGNVIPSKK